MNCFLLADEKYVNSVMELIPIWAAEGRKELSDDRGVWDWIKYNIRAHADWHARKRLKERGKKELRPGSDAVLHMSRIECKWAKSFVLSHLHSIRLMWSTASELGLSLQHELNKAKQASEKKKSLCFSYLSLSRSSRKSRSLLWRKTKGHNNMCSSSLAWTRRKEYKVLF